MPYNQKPKKSFWSITKDTDNPVNQSKVEANTCSLREARENSYEPITVGVGFTSDWLTKWREFLFKPITKRTNVKPKQTQISVDTQLKISLKQV